MSKTESFEFLNELALAFRAAENHPRPQCAPVLEGVRAVLAHLQSAGRLLADDETRLTAEQVEDVRTARAGLRGYRNFDGNARGRVNRLIAAVDALFPATDLAEHVHEQGAHYTRGHTKAGTWTVSTCRTCGAVIERATEDGAWIDRTDPLAPAEPAEEEMKAEEKLVAHRDSKGDIYVGHALVAFKHRSYEQIRRWFNEAHPGGISERRYRAVLHLLNVEASSPVIPAPAETGPWQTWEAVPDGVTVKSANGERFRKTGVGAIHLLTNGVGDCCKISVANDLQPAPFVAAEEGRA